MGLGKNLNKPATSNSALTQSLIDLGAVIFCKTNVPQTVFRYSSDNPIYGETLSHTNLKLAPGGSSSGTASLVAAGGVPFATGTDIAGSIRIPSHFSRLCGLKPTQNRISDKGIMQTLPKLIGCKSFHDLDDKWGLRFCFSFGNTWSIGKGHGHVGLCIQGTVNWQSSKYLRRSSSSHRMG